MKKETNNILGEKLILDYKHSLIKFTAVLSLFLTGISTINFIPNTGTTQQVQAATKKSSKTKKLNAVTKLAKKQVGKRYVWGATGPSSFDCSGLVQYVYRKAGDKNLPRTTYSQVNVGKKVSLKHLKKGDLLFWGSASAPYHVGIYVGGGKYVHAATPAQGVRKQTLSTYFYPSAAKRVL
mgnify:CR=1 FL=1